MNNTINQQSKCRNLSVWIKVEIKEKNTTYQQDKCKDLPVDIKAKKKTQLVDKVNVIILLLLLKLN